MKNLEEIYKEYSDNPLQFMRDNNCLYTKDNMLALMKKAYNKAIDDCIENAEVEILSYNHGDCQISKESLLKLKL